MCQDETRTILQLIALKASQAYNQLNGLHNKVLVNQTLNEIKAITLAELKKVD